MNIPDAPSDDLWIRRFHPGPERSCRLVCLPHAGGSASFFFPLSDALAGLAEVLAIQYPGRQDRRGEPLLDTVDALVDGVENALRPWLDRPLVLLGHSMGAVLSFELARRFQGRDGVRLLGLIASGRRAPTVYRAEQLHRRGDAALIAELRSLAGTDSGLLADEEVIRMVLPAVRADYTAIETYRYDRASSAPALRCPVSVLTGESDPRVGIDEAKAWQQVTDGEFALRTFPGGHFYLTAQKVAVAAAIAEDLATFSRASAP